MLGGFLFLLPANIPGSPVDVLGALNVLVDADPLGALVDADPVAGAGEDLAAPAETVDVEPLLLATIFLFLIALGGGADDAGICEAWC